MVWCIIRGDFDSIKNVVKLEIEMLGGNDRKTDQITNG